MPVFVHFPLSIGLSVNAVTMSTRKKETKRYVILIFMVYMFTLPARICDLITYFFMPEDLIIL